MEVCIAASNQWCLHKYARFLSVQNQTIQQKVQTSGEWEYFDSVKEKLTLTLTSSNQLILTQGFTILESHLLSQCKSWMRGVVKGDSFLILSKIKGQTRRFRMKFHSESDCKLCQAKLSTFFPVKLTESREANETTQQEDMKTEALKAEKSKCKDRPVIKLSGEITLGEMAKVLTGLTKAELPEAYKHCHLSTDTMDTFVRLCLADPTFPAYVGLVENSMDKIIKETES